MNNKIKQTLLVIVGLLLSTSTFAQDFEVDGIYYNYLDESSKTVSVAFHEGNKYTGTVTVPSSVTHNGTTYSVTSIGERAFIGCNKMTSIVIPNSITSIDEYAFAYCSGLTSIAIPNSVKTIGDKAFRYCKGLSSVTIPDSVTSIGEKAFASCQSLLSVVLGKSVKTIGLGAFLLSWNLEKVTSLNPTPPTGLDTFSDDVYFRATLYVPKNSYNKYSANKQWRRFANIKKM